MDTTALVSESIKLIQLLDEGGHPPRGAMLVQSDETEIYRLWIIPSKSLEDKQSFYREISSIMAARQKEFINLDAGDVDLRSADHPAVQTLGSFMRVEGLGAGRVTNMQLNGFFLPSGIILRMAL